MTVAKSVNRTKQMTGAAKAARRALAEGRCASALDAISLYEYARGARTEERGSAGSTRDNWKLTTGVALNLRSAFRDRCMKPNLNKGTRR